jgi:DNA-binding transcriptional MerR regulator
VNAFTLGDVARICRVSASRLRYWERTALLAPTLQVDSRPAFAFPDLVGVKRLVELLERGVSLRRIRRSVEAARERMPEVERPLGALRLWDEATRRIVVRHAGALFEADGQLVLDFARGGSGGVEPMPARGAEPAAATGPEAAAAWFDLGCQLDTDPATCEEAIQAYRLALEADPDCADAHCNLGSIHFNRNRRAEARACFERALEIEPAHPEANLNLAALLEDAGCDERALRHYRVALAADPLCADTHVSLAMLYEKLGLRRRAREHWRRYLQLDPKGPWADVASRRLADA